MCIYILHKKALRRLVTGIRSVETSHRWKTWGFSWNFLGPDAVQPRFKKKTTWLAEEFLAEEFKKFLKIRWSPCSEWNVRLDAVRVAAWARVNITKRAGEMDLSLLSLPTKVIQRWTKGPPLAIQIFFGQMAGPTRRPPRHKWAYNATHRGYTVTPVAHVQGARITGSGAHLVPSTPKL